MRRSKKTAVIVATGGALALGLLTNSGAPSGVRVAHAGHSMTAKQWQLLSGASQQALGSLGVLDAYAAGRPEAELGGDSEGAGAARGTATGSALNPNTSGGLGNIFPDATGRCIVHFGAAVRVNTDCENATDTDLHGRAQAQNETAIAVNPTNTKNLIASANDYRRGDGNCGTYFSNDRGESWNGGVAPMSFIRGSSMTPSSGNARQYWQAGGDTSVTFDSQGTAYLSCQVFNRGAGVTQDPDVSSAFLVFRSDNGGASWDFPGRVVASSYEPNGSFSNGIVLLDKQLMTTDSNPSSPFADRIYLTWTTFATDGSAYIYEAHSSDAGETFSSPVLVSRNSAPLCPITYGAGTSNGNCNANQFSDPFVGPDGSLYVVWANFNNCPPSDTCNSNGITGGSDNRNQMLLAKSTDGGASFSAPIKAGDYYDLPDCVTYTGKDAGRACVVDKGSSQNSVFRAANYPSGVVDPTNKYHLIVNYGSYINKNSNENTGCTPNGVNSNTGNNLYTGATTTACNNQILQVESIDGGVSFNGGTIDPRSLPVVGHQSAVADEFWQWTTIEKTGRVDVEYWDRQYGTDNNDGSSDISVAFGTTVRRVTTTSMPPPTQFGGVFLGDYVIAAVGTAKINGSIVPAMFATWSDTRDIGVTSCPPNIGVRNLCVFGYDEDMFTAPVGLK